ncbi:RICIN domain-containing protein [Kitasatospora sp. NPDC056446]|uniref:RICIN domain-containing protein n=1 Tax=Kitasatospora sp. NPDC056446 TaxID=3345819 RepID=UPI00368DD081
MDSASRPHRARTAAAVVGSVVALLAALPAPAAHASGTFVTTFVNVNSGKCLEIADLSTDDGAAAQQWDCDGGDNQLWDVVYYPGGQYTIVNRHSGKCLEIADFDREDGGVARQWTCTWSINQHWYPSAFLDEISAGNLVNAYSGRLLEIADWSTENGAPAQQWGEGSAPVEQAPHKLDANKRWISNVRPL